MGYSPKKSRAAQTSKVYYRNMANRQMHPNSLKNLIPGMKEGADVGRKPLKKGQKTKAIAIRVPEDIKLVLEEEAQEKGMALSEYLRLIIYSRNKR